MKKHPLTHHNPSRVGIHLTFPSVEEDDVTLKSREGEIMEEGVSANIEVDFKSLTTKPTDVP